MRGGQEVAVKAGRAHAFHGDGEAIGWRQRRHQGSLQLGLREELLPVLQVGRVHLEEGGAARVAWLQHGCRRRLRGQRTDRRHQGTNGESLTHTSDTFIQTHKPN